MATLNGEFQNSNLFLLKIPNCSPVVLLFSITIIEGITWNISSLTVPRDRSVTERDKKGGWERASFDAERKDLKLQREE